MHPALLLLKKVPRGRVTTYKTLADVCNTSPRAIGQVMKRNKYPEVYPCYKAVRSDGTIGGYAGKVKGNKIREKIEKLSKDGIVVRNGRIDKKYFWEFD